jgi:hypothetical protein
MKTLSLIEKISLIWSIPLTSALILLAFVYSVLKFIFQSLFVYSGPAGSMSFLFIKMKQTSLRKIWKRIEDEDSMIKNFDARN